MATALLIFEGPRLRRKVSELGAWNALALACFLTAISPLLYFYLVEGASGLAQLNSPAGAGESTLRAMARAGPALLAGALDGVLAQKFILNEHVVTRGTSALLLLPAMAILDAHLATGNRSRRLTIFAWSAVLLSATTLLLVPAFALRGHYHDAILALYPWLPLAVGLGWACCLPLTAGRPLEILRLVIPAILLTCDAAATIGLRRAILSDRVAPEWSYRLTSDSTVFFDRFRRPLVALDLGFRSTIPTLTRGRGRMAFPEQPLMPMFILDGGLSAKNYLEPGLIYFVHSARTTVLPSIRRNFFRQCAANGWKPVLVGRMSSVGTVIEAYRLVSIGHVTKDNQAFGRRP